MPVDRSLTIGVGSGVPPEVLSVPKDSQVPPVLLALLKDSQLWLVVSLSIPLQLHY